MGREIRLTANGDGSCLSRDGIQLLSAVAIERVGRDGGRYGRIESAFDDEEVVVTVGRNVLTLTGDGSAGQARDGAVGLTDAERSGRIGHGAR